MTDEIAVEVVEQADAALLEVANRLVAQLSSSPVPMTAAELDEIVSSPCSHLLVARATDGAVVGMLTLVVFRIPTGVRAWIEDVVVDRAARRGGAGAALTRAALALAEERGARSVDLTSRPSREAANRLYRRLGFAERATNVYRHQAPAT